MRTPVHNLNLEPTLLLLKQFGSGGLISGGGKPATTGTILQTEDLKTLVSEDGTTTLVTE